MKTCKNCQYSWDEFFWSICEKRNGKWNGTLNLEGKCIHFTPLARNVIKAEEYFDLCLNYISVMEERHNTFNLMLETYIN